MVVTMENSKTLINYVNKKNLKKTIVFVKTYLNIEEIIYL